MKRFFGILNLILCFELIIGPNFPGLRVFSLEVAKAETCPSGLVFDSTLNRCITSDQQASLMNATASCNGDKECYKRLAEEELKKGEEEGKIAEAVANKGGLIGTGMKVAAIAGPLTVVLGALTGQSCMNASGIAMVAGGIAFTAGNFLADGKHKKCLKKIRDEWEKKKAANTQQTSSGITKVSMAGAQSEAFEMLAKSEECMQSSAKMKSGFYAASTLAFAASAVLAGLEQFGVTGGTCQESGTSEATTATSQTASDAAATASQAAADATAAGGGAVAPIVPPTRVIGPVPRHDIEKQYGLDPNHASIQNLKIRNQFLFNINDSSDLPSLLANYQSLNQSTCASIEDYERIKFAFENTGIESNTTFMSFFKVALAGFVNELRPMRTAEATVGSAATGILRSINTPTGRMIISGVLAGMSGIMWMHANKQARVAKNRAEFLRKMKEDFNDSMGAISCTQEERNISANANCYCYNEDGQRNTARGNSQVCQQLWSGKTTGTPGTFAAQDFSNQRVCISASGKPDENCACKQTKNCLNAIPATGNLGLGAISVASNGMSPVNSLANGQIGAGSINGAAAVSSAARLLDQKKKLEAKAKITPTKASKLANDIQGSIIAAGSGAPSPLESSSSLPMNMSASQAASALEKELGQAERAFERVSGSPALAQPGGSTPVDESGFSFNTPEQAAPTEETQLAEAMGQDLNYGQNDITKSDSNIFNILSNRYQRSGMRRLFDEDKNSKPEPAAKSDIAP